MANDKKIDFKVGEKYLAVDGFEYECLFVEDHYVYLRSDKGHCAYVWDHYGISINLNSDYNIIPPKPEPVVRWGVVSTIDGSFDTTLETKEGAEDYIMRSYKSYYKVIKLQEVQE